MILSTKRSYHPYIPLAFHLQLLPKVLLTQLPRSTKQYWKSKNQADLFGYGLCPKQQDMIYTLSLVARNKKLLALNKALLHILAIKKYVQTYLFAIKQKRPAIVQTLVYNVHKITGVLGLTKALKFTGLSYAWWLKFSQLNSCNKSHLFLCRRKHPAQLLHKEINTITRFCNDPIFFAWPLASLYHHLVRNGLLYCSIASFYKYASLLGVSRFLPASRRKNHVDGIRAAAPLTIIHADITEFKTTNHTKAFIFFVQDNFSRIILGYKVATDKKAEHLVNLVKTVLAQYASVASTQVQVITDDGAENKHLASAFTNQSVSILHLVAQKDIIFSNSMIEYLNRTIKYRYLYQQSIHTISDLERALAYAVEDYNNRPAHVLKGLTPLETLNGLSPETEKIRQQIKEASLTRIFLNKKEDCCL